MHSHGPIYYFFHSHSVSYLVLSLNQRSASKVHYEFTNLSLWWYKNDIAESAWVGVTTLHSSLFSAMLCSCKSAGASPAISYWGAVLIHHQGSPSSSTPPKCRGLGAYLYCLSLLVVRWVTLISVWGIFRCCCKQNSWKVCKEFKYSGLFINVCF